MKNTKQNEKVTELKSSARLRNKREKRQNGDSLQEEKHEILNNRKTTNVNETVSQSKEKNQEKFTELKSSARLRNKREKRQNGDSLQEDCNR